MVTFKLVRKSIGGSDSGDGVVLAHFYGGGGSILDTNEVV